MRSESNKLSKMGDYFVARKASSESSIAFIHGVLKVLIERGWVREDFIQKHTEGWADLRAAVEGLGFEALEAQAGLPRSSM